MQSHELQLEVTETGVMRDRAGSAALLRELAARGVRLAIDDFGTGYSSLAALHEFPFDTLKIDGSFVRNLDSDARFKPLVQAVVTLADNLGLKTVAEGVETQSQAAALRTMGCSSVQGFLFSRPLEADRVLAFANHVRHHAAAPW
jgi:EAL domain-containing protein (putative c-di-GMP-specific phosphodiesterase class I)